MSQYAAHSLTYNGTFIHCTYKEDISYAVSEGLQSLHIHYGSCFYTPTAALLSLQKHKEFGIFGLYLSMQQQCPCVNHGLSSPETWTDVLFFREVELLQTNSPAATKPEGLLTG